MYVSLHLITKLKTKLKGTTIQTKPVSIICLIIAIHFFMQYFYMCIIKCIFYCAPPAQTVVSKLLTNIRVKTSFSSLFVIPLVTFRASSLDSCQQWEGFLFFYILTSMCCYLLSCQPIRCTVSHYDRTRMNVILKKLLLVFLMGKFTKKICSSF